MSLGTKTRDLLLYVGIGLAIVASMLAGLVLAPRATEYVSDKLLPLAVAAAVVFGYAMKDHRRDLKKARFWLLFGALFVVHVEFWLHYVYPNFGVPRLFAGFALTMAEGLVVWSLLYLAFSAKTRR